MGGQLDELLAPLTFKWLFCFMHGDK